MSNFDLDVFFSRHWRIALVCAVTIASTALSPVFANDEAVGQKYVATVQQAIRAHWHPPSGPIFREIHVSFEVNRDGSVSNIKVKNSCGDVTYDNAAIEAVRAAQPMMPPPPPLNAQPFVSLDIGIAYNPKNGSATRLHAIALRNKGVMLLREGSEPDAIKQFELSMKADPTYPDPRKSLANIYINAALYEKDPSQALRLMHKAMSVAPEEDNNGRLDKAIRSLGKDPDSFDDRVSLGDDAANAGDSGGAIYEYGAALKIKPDQGVQTKLNQAIKSQHN